MLIKCYFVKTLLGHWTFIWQVLVHCVLYQHSIWWSNNILVQKQIIALNGIIARIFDFLCLSLTQGSFCYLELSFHFETLSFLLSLSFFRICFPPYPIVSIKIVLHHVREHTYMRTIARVPLFRHPLPKMRYRAVVLFWKTLPESSRTAQRIVRYINYAQFFSGETKPSDSLRAGIGELML